MAKLARLMVSELPTSIEPEKLAVSGACLSGHLVLSEMTRMAALVLNPAGLVSFRLSFGRNDHGVVEITGNLSATVVVVCQRCLNEMELMLDNPVRIGIVGSHEQARDLPGNLEPVVSAQHELSLVDLIDEELTLGMPFAPLHDRDNCPAAELTGQYTPVKRNPFAVLEELKSCRKNNR